MAILGTLPIITDYFRATDPNGNLVLAIKVGGEVEFGPGYTAPEACKEGARMFAEFVHQAIVGCEIPKSH